MEAIQYHLVSVKTSSQQEVEQVNTIQCLILSPDEMNNNLRSVVVAPLIPGPQNYPTRVRIKNNNEAGWVALDQITTIEKDRILNDTGILSPSEIKRIKSVIKEAFID